eukprot:jgi/Psemu1/41110/gm1.41110_g
MKAVLGKEEKTSFNIDNAQENLDEYLKAEQKSLSSNSNPGEPHHKDQLFIFTNNGPPSVQFEEQTPPELVRGKECQHTYPIAKEDYSVSSTRFLDFDENCTYTVDDPLFWDHTRLVPTSQSYRATDIAKWDFMKVHLKNFETFIEENGTYSVRWLVFTNKDKLTDNSSKSSIDGDNPNNVDEEDDNVEAVNGNEPPTEPIAVKENASTKAKKKSFLTKHTKQNKNASDKSNGGPKYKERKVSPNLGHVEDLGYLLQVPRPRPDNVVAPKRSGNVKVLFADPDPVISYPKFAIGSEVTITGIPAPGTGVVKSYAWKRKDLYPQYPGYMVHKKLPDGTTVKRATWFPYNRVG